jgi:hypothetical protein
MPWILNPLAVDEVKVESAASPPIALLPYITYTTPADEMVPGSDSRMSFFVSPLTSPAPAMSVVPPVPKNRTPVAGDNATPSETSGGEPLRPKITAPITTLDPVGPLLPTPTSLSPSPFTSPNQATEYPICCSTAEP